MKREIYLLLSMLLVSCNIQDPDIASRKGVVININENLDRCETIEFDDFIDSAYMIALKTPKNHHQTYITKATIAHNKLFTFDELDTKRVNAYNLSGDFLYGVAKLGRSSNEFINVSNFSVCNNKIYVTDPIQKRSIVFSADDGSHLYNLKYPFGAVEMNQLGDNRYLFMLTNYNADKGIDYLTNSILITDSIYNPVAWGMPHPKADNIKSVSRSHWNTSDYNLFYSHYDETIYEYNMTNNNITPIYSFDFGKYSLPLSAYNSIDKYMKFYSKETTRRFSTESPILIGDYIFANVNDGNKKYMIACKDGVAYSKLITQDNYELDMPYFLLGKASDNTLITEVMIPNNPEDLIKYGIQYSDDVTNILLVSILH